MKLLKREIVYFGPQFQMDAVNLAGKDVATILEGTMVGAESCLIM